MRTITPKHAFLVPKDASQVFHGVIYDVYQWQQKLFNGTFETFEMLKRPDTVKVLAVKDNQLVVLDQEQPGYPSFYDLPGGRHDIPSESELDAVKRETLEETGMSFQSWKLLDVTQPHSKIEAFIYIFLATDFISQAGQKLDGGEKINVLSFDLQTVKDMLNKWDPLESTCRHASLSIL